MAKRSTGELRVHQNRDGTRTFSARVRVGGNRRHVPLGHERDGMTLLEAEKKLEDILARARLGTYRPTSDRRDHTRGEADVFVAAASRFLKAKAREGLKPASLGSLSWALNTHLTPFFGRDRVRGIDMDRVESYVDRQIARRDEINRLKAQNAYLEGPKGGAMRPMGSRSINTTLEILTQLFDWTAARGYGPDGPNPAAGVRLRAPARANFALELDELDDLIEAAGRQHSHVRSDRSLRLGQQATVLRTEGRAWKEIAAELGIAESTAIYHHRCHKREEARSADEPAAIEALADRALLCTLAFSGARVTELCRLTVDQVDLGRQRLRIPDSKTPSGIREVHLSPRLVDELGTYLAARSENGGGALLFPSPTGRRRSKDTVNKRVVAPACEHANTRRASLSLPPLPRTTPHTLRRTYITLALEAGLPVPFVMAQVGHSDSRTTLQIYAKVLARRDRSEHGRAFDQLVGGTLPSPPNATILPHQVLPPDSRRVQ